MTQTFQFALIFTIIAVTLGFSPSRFSLGHQIKISETRVFEVLSSYIFALVELLCDYTLFIFFSLKC